MIRTVCPHDCPDACSIAVTVENGRVTRCEGDPTHPFTRGFLCHKVGSYEQRIESPHRILHPMLRRTKGGPLERVSWDEALDVIHARLGSGESVLPYSYGGNMGLIARSAGHAFFHKLGACRLQRTICDEAGSAAWESMIGKAISTDLERMPECDVIVVWGMNAAVVNIHAMPFIRDAQKRGAQLIVLDPYRTETARQADMHIQLRPGTDAALALGICRYILDKGAVRTDYIESYCQDWERFQKRLADYPVERCQEICGVGDIPALAERLLSARAPFFRLGIGFTRHANGGQAVRSILALAAMLGAFEHGGAAYETWEAFEVNNDVLTRPDLLPYPTRQVNMVQLGDVLTQDDSIKSIFIYQCNPAAVCPDQSKVVQGLRRDDLFVVVHEQVDTDTVDYADVVLPACTSFENADLFRSYGHYYLQRTRAVIEPMGESRSNVQMFRALARRFGFTEEIFDMDEEARIELLLSTRSGALAHIDMEALQRGDPVRIDVGRGNPFEKGFPTPSGRFMFANDGLPDPLPSYVPCPEGCDSPLRERFPLQLLAPPAKHFLNTTFGSVPSLVARQKRPTALLHPLEASARALQDGALIRLFNDRGETRATLVVTEDVPPGVTVVPSVWWNRHVEGGMGVNALTSQRLTDLGGSSTFHCALVEVSACEPLSS